MDGNLEGVMTRLAGPASDAAEALREIYNALAPGVFASLRARRVSQVDLEDIVQETFLKLWSNRLNVPQDANLAAYVWCMARNAWIDRIRKRSKMDLSRLALLRPIEGHSRDDTSDSEFLSCLERVFESYRSAEPERAHAIELVAVQGLDHHHLATALGRSQGAAREYLSQARREFLHLYQERCGEGAQ